MLNSKYPETHDSQQEPASPPVRPDRGLSAVVAASICWLYRQGGVYPSGQPWPGKPGLPNIPGLRAAVVQRHGDSCPYCGSDPAELISRIEVWLAAYDLSTR